MADLFTKEEFKGHHGTPAAVTIWDGWIAQILAPSVTALVDRFCQRTFAQAAHIEFHDGTGTTCVSVKHPPIEPTTPAPILNVDPDRAFLAATEVAASKYVIRNGRRLQLLPQSTVAARLFVDSTVFPRGVQNVKITYTGGFATIPIEVKLAALEWAVVIFNRRRAAGLATFSVGSGGTVTLKADPLPKDTKKLLASYRIQRITRGVGA
jgi:hypothetical protein